MHDPLAAIRASIEASFASAEDPAALLARLDAELAIACAALLEAAAPVPFAELDALAEVFRDRSRALPRAVQTAHHAWLRRDRRWYKPILAPDGTLQAPPMPEGVLCVSLELVPRLYAAIAGLRRDRHLREHPAACDCAALVAAGLDREPRSSALRLLGPGSDGYHRGELFVCDACGARWLRGYAEGSLGRTFWEPARAR